MLTLTIKGDEFFNEETEEFEYEKLGTVVLEHSLVSLSKWESFWEKPFLTGKDKTREETLSYILMMNVDPSVDPKLFDHLSDQNIREINEYIESKQTATWFSDSQSKKKQEKIVTAEVIYSMMIALNVPFECQHWHLNKLLTLLRVCDTQNTPPKKMPAAEIARRNRELNAKRKAELGTSG